VSLTLAAPPAVETWHRVDVRSSTALARTRVSLIGVLDGRAVEKIDEAVQVAHDNGHELSIELGEISSITPDAVVALLPRH
jgi:hypothetical protein